MAKRKHLNKKGNLLDFIYLIGAILSLAIVSLVVFKFVNAWNTQISVSGLADPIGMQASNEIEDMFPTTVDNTFFFLVIGLCLIAVFLASLTYFHPVFFILYIPLMIFAVILGGIMSNIYQGMASDANFIALADRLVFMSHIMQFLPIIVAVFSIVLAIVMYSNRSG